MRHPRSTLWKTRSNRYEDDQAEIHRQESKPPIGMPRLRGSIPFNEDNDMTDAVKYEDAPIS